MWAWSVPTRGMTLMLSSDNINVDGVGSVKRIESSIAIQRLNYWQYPKKALEYSDEVVSYTTILNARRVGCSNPPTLRPYFSTLSQVTQL